MQLYVDDKVAVVPNSIATAIQLEESYQWIYPAVVMNASSSTLRPREKQPVVAKSLTVSKGWNLTFITLLLKFTDSLNDVLVFSVGISRKFYCASASRSVLLRPTKHQLHVGQVLRESFHAVASGLKVVVGHCRKFDIFQAGITGSHLYTALEDAVAVRDPSLLPHMPRACGHAIGIQFKDESFVVKKGSMFHNAACFHIEY